MALERENRLIELEMRTLRERIKDVDGDKEALTGQDTERRRSSVSSVASSSISQAPEAREVALLERQIKAKIEQGPDEDLSGFLETLHSLEDAIRFFESNSNFKSSSICK